MPDRRDRWTLVYTARPTHRRTYARCPASPTTTSAYLAD